MLGCLTLAAGPKQASAATRKVVIVCKANSPRLDFAVDRLAEALRRTGHAPDRRTQPVAGADIVITAGTAEAALRPEGFRIERRPADGRSLLRVTARDDSGAMYGTLDLAEQLSMAGSLEGVRAGLVNPRFAFRAIKFNLPWMSYRRSDALSLHHETCRDLKFWRAFLDMMAVNRFNVLSLWNLHPFPWMVRPKSFPEACPFSDEELADWQRFWRALFRMAKDRGIDPYIVNWNIFVSPSLAEKHRVATYSRKWSYFGNGDTSELVRRYNRECVTQVIDEYEDLAGIGVSLGERMGGMTPLEREEWITGTIVEGIRNAKRRVRFIHRAPFSAGKGSGGSTGTSTEKLTRRAIEGLDLPAPIWVEVKFNWSHGHSSPRLCRVHGGKISDAYWNPPPEKYKLTWMIRNEDFFMLRWGEPGFIREHIRRNGKPYCGGYFVGSECYIPAKDYFSKPDPRIDWRYAFERQWLFYMLWGRLLYDPTTPEAVFAAEFDRRYGAGAGMKLLRAYELASRMPLRLASFHGATSDFTLYSEGFLAPVVSGGLNDRASHFISIDELIKHRVLDPTYMSVPEYVAASKAGRQVAAGTITPPGLADSLEEDARAALSLIRPLVQKARRAPGPLDFELIDISAWADLSLYFAEKLRAAVALHTFRTTKAAGAKATAVRHLETAAEHWDALVALTRPVYREVPLVHLRKGTFHWHRYSAQVRRDLDLARNAE